MVIIIDALFIILHRLLTFPLTALPSIHSHLCFLSPALPIALFSPRLPCNHVKIINVLHPITQPNIIFSTCGPSWSSLPLNLIITILLFILGSTIPSKLNAFNPNRVIWLCFEFFYLKYILVCLLRNRVLTSDKCVFCECKTLSNASIKVNTRNE